MLWRTSYFVSWWCCMHYGNDTVWLAIPKISWTTSRPSTPKTLTMLFVLMSSIESQLVFVPKHHTVISRSSLCSGALLLFKTTGSDFPLIVDSREPYAAAFPSNAFQGSLPVRSLQWKHVFRNISHWKTSRLRIWRHSGFWKLVQCPHFQTKRWPPSCLLLHFDIRKLIIVRIQMWMDEIAIVQLVFK